MLTVKTEPRLRTARLGFAMGLVLVGTAYPDQVVGSPGASWQAFPNDFVAAKNTIYWNGGQFSDSIPNYITGKDFPTSAYLNVSPFFNSGLEWWGKAPGAGPLATQDLNITFANLSPYFAARRFWQTGSNIEFGWYPAGHPEVRHPLLGWNPPLVDADSLWVHDNGGLDFPQARRFNPSGSQPTGAEYGFYAVVLGVYSSSGEEHRYYTEARFNCEMVSGACIATNGIDQEQHFAVFREAGQDIGYQAFWVALQDQPFAINGSYNGSLAGFSNVVVHVSPHLPFWVKTGFPLQSSGQRVVFPDAPSPIHYGVLEDFGHWWTSLSLVNKTGTPWQNLQLIAGGIGARFEATPSLRLNGGATKLAGWAMDRSSDGTSLKLFFQDFQVLPGEFLIIDTHMYSPSGCRGCMWNLAANYNIAAPPNLRPAIAAKSGPLSLRQWSISLHNYGIGTAGSARVTGISLTQTGGPLCSPSVVSLPPPYGDIAPNAEGSQTAMINASGCSAIARFTLRFTYTAASGYSGSFELRNQFP